MPVSKHTTSLSGYFATDGNGARRLFLSKPVRNLDAGPLGPFNCWYATGYPEVLRIPEDALPPAIKAHSWEHAPLRITLTIDFIKDKESISPRGET